MDPKYGKSVLDYVLAKNFDELYMSTNMNIDTTPYEIRMSDHAFIKLQINMQLYKNTVQYIDMWKPCMIRDVNKLQNVDATKLNDIWCVKTVEQVKGMIDRKVSVEVVQSFIEQCLI